MQVKASKTGAVIFEFSGQSDLTDYVDGNKFRRRLDPREFEFVGHKFDSWEDVETFAKQTWEDGIMQLEMFVERLRKTEMRPIKSHKRIVVWGTTGDELDLDKLTSGDPNCWKSYKREKTDGPTSLTVIIDTSTPCNIDSYDILWRGAAAIALAFLLEEKGYSVELWVINGATFFAHDKYPGITAACLKRTSDPLDMSTLVNTVAGWFYRTVTFTLMDTIGAKTNQSIKSTYGQVYNPTEVDLDEITPDTLRIYSTGVFNFNGAVSLMESELGKLADGSESLPD